MSEKIRVKVAFELETDYDIEDFNSLDEVTNKGMEDFWRDLQGGVELKNIEVMNSDITDEEDFQAKKNELEN